VIRAGASSCGPVALKSLSRLGRTDRDRILAALGRLPEGDVQRFAGTVGLYRLRVGDWRAILRRDDQEWVITVAQVLPPRKRHRGL
jgi:mRNA-degrading endonuclease RelE of RelBE toxin-antitoxin system